MASIGAGWVDGAWVQAAWATGAWAEASAPAVDAGGCELQLVDGTNLRLVDGSDLELTTCVTRKGGWLSPEQVRGLRDIQRKAEKSRRREWERRQEEERAALERLRAIYNRVQGIAPEEIETGLAEVVSDFIAEPTAENPFAEPTIDWAALLASAEAVARLAQVLTELERIQNEEAAIGLLVMAA